MPSNELWTQIPSVLLDAGGAVSQAEDWASQQRAKLADTWAAAQKVVLGQMQNQWMQKASDLAAPAMTPDDLGKLSGDTGTMPIPAKTLPDTSESPNPADILNQSRETSLRNMPHLQPGTPENAFLESMREGASHAGVYLPPPPGSVVDPNKETQLQSDAEQNKTRPFIGPLGLGLYNPNLNPEGAKLAVSPGEPGQVVGEVAGEAPVIGGLLKFAAGAEGEPSGPGAEIKAPPPSPEFLVAQGGAQGLFQQAGQGIAAAYDAARQALQGKYGPDWPQVAPTEEIARVEDLAGQIAGKPSAVPQAAIGGAAGAAYGSTQGQTPEERAQNALKYGIGGALAGHFLGGGDLPFGMSVKQVFNDPDLDRAVEMIHADPPEAAYLASQPFLDRVHSAFVRAWTDNGVDLAKIQESVAKTLGRPLNANEMLAELRRLNPDVAAETNLYRNLAPAIRSVGDDKDALSLYLMHRHNVEVANAMGGKAAQALIAKPLQGLPLQGQLATLQTRLSTYQRFLAQAQAGNNAPAIARYTPLVAQTQTLATNVEKKLAAQVGPAQVARTVAAYQAGQAVSAARKFSGTFDLDSSIRSLITLENKLGPQRFQKVQDAALQVTQFGRDLLQRKVDSGIITQGLADHLNQLYPEYVPIKILDHMIEPITSGAGGKNSLSLRETGIKALTQEGTDAFQEDPLAAMTRLAYSTEAAARKNETFNALHNLVQADPSLQNTFKQVAKASAESDRVSKTIQGFVNGAPVIYSMPSDLAAAIENVSKTSLPPAFQQAMSFIRMVLASRNPTFIPTHALITSIPYAIRTTTREGGVTAIPRVLAALGSAYFDAFKGLGSGRYGADTERYLRAGGGMFANVFDYSPSAARLEVEDLARGNALSLRNLADIRKVSSDIIRGRPFGEIINRVDLAPRVAAFRRAEKRGANLTQAVTEGRTASLDFAQGGEWAKQINQLIPFFNVAMQGTAAPVRAMRDNPRAFIESAIALLAAPTVGIEAWNRSDPQRARDYDDVPNYYKDTGLVIMAPDSAEVDAAGNRKPNYIYIPTREFSPFVVATREIAGRAIGGRTIAGQAFTGPQNARTWQSLLYGNDLLRPSGGLLGSASPGVEAGRYIPGGPLGNIGIAAMTGINPTTGARAESQAANARTGLVAQGVAGAVRAGQTAMGGMPTAQSSAVQYGLNELGGPGRALGAIGEPQGAPSINPLWKNATGQTLQDVRNQRLSEPLRQLLLDAGLPEVTPASQVISKLPLHQDEEAELQANLNAAFEQVAEKIISDPRYQNASDAAKKAYVQKVLTNVRKVVGTKFLRTLEARDGSDALRQRIRDAGALKKAS